MCKILVIGGTHGNELLGVKLVESLQKQPLENVDAILANPRAVKENTRFTETDLNRSFGTQKTATFEVKRAREIQKLAAGYDIVLDFHNTQTPGNNCSFVGDGCDPVLYGAAKTLGFSTCIEATYDCINKYCPNTISIEISVCDALDDPAVWREKIADLAKRKNLETAAPLALYRFFRRVTWGEKAENNFTGWRPFVKINEADKKALGVRGDIVPIFIGSRLTEFYATLLVREREV